ncbi:MAG: catalase [Clostridia bacterium]|nr:catalase [Clostridia bacterium]
MNFTGHFKTITAHKLLVMKYCFRVGLYRQGLMHDMSKYMPSEFLIGAKYYKGTESPNNVERRETGVSSAWLHHKGRNKHHFEYWMDYGLDKNKGIVGMKMPKKYVAEMFCDRLAASKIYMGDKYYQEYPLEYFNRSRHRIIIHPETEAELEKMLVMLRDKGEDAVFEYIKRELVKK